MTFRIRVGAVAGLLLLALSGPASGQIPGDELPVMSRSRNEFLANTCGEVKQVLADWQTFHTKGDAKQLTRLFTEDGLFSPVDGWYVQGRAALADTMATRVGRSRVTTPPCLITPPAAGWRITSAGCAIGWRAVPVLT